MARSRGSTADAPPAARSDVYTGLLLIALLAQIAGAVFFFMDYSQYGKGKASPPPKQVSPTVSPPPGGQQGGQVGGGQQGGQVGGKQQGGPPGGPAGGPPGGPAGGPPGGPPMGGMGGKGP
jgi:hypothetical protein